METPLSQEFKIIKDFENYQISNDGYVYSLYYNKMLKPEINQGYCRVTLKKDKKGHHFVIHRLVANAFIPNPDNKPCVNHIDENRLNNHVSNLEWVTSAENTRYSCKGSKKFADMISKRTSIPVIQYDKNMNKIAEYASSRNAEKETNILNAGISKCCRGNQKTSGGFIWKFKYENSIKDKTIIDVKDYEDTYQVTTDGKIYNKILKRYLKGCLSKDGYLGVQLCSSDKPKKHYQIHRVVAEHFLPKKDGKYIVNHKDSNRANNSITNLEWVTHSENMNHAVESGNRKTRAVRQLTIDGVLINTFRSIIKAEKLTNTDHRRISNVCSGKRKSTNGFRWEYII